MDRTIGSREWAVLLVLLREVRREAGLTQIELAQRLGRTQSLVSDIESGQRRVDIVELRTLCGVLGLSLEQLVQRWEQRLSEK
jgi:transcriptional regulator with XRE-family HTH domain